ncbi:unnamed protein product [Amoebophrya sp. A120]|nr:unnamed protein product [Amoebophrya sp. A120]|eukprot:GSA120T00005801001.1
MMALRLLWGTAAGHQLLMAQTNITAVQAANIPGAGGRASSGPREDKNEGKLWNAHLQAGSDFFSLVRADGEDEPAMFGFQRLNEGLAWMSTQGHQELTLVTVSPEGNATNTKMRQQGPANLGMLSWKVVDEEEEPEQTTGAASASEEHDQDESTKKVDGIFGGGAGAGTPLGRHAVTQAKSGTMSIGKVEEQKPEKQDIKSKKKQGIFGGGFAKGFLEPKAEAQPAATPSKDRKPESQRDEEASEAARENQDRVVLEKEESGGAPADSKKHGYPGTSVCTGTGSQEPAATSKSKLLVGGREQDQDVTARFNEIDEDMKMWEKLMADMAESDSDDDEGDGVAALVEKLNMIRRKYVPLALESYSGGSASGFLKPKAKGKPAATPLEEDPESKRDEGAEAAREKEDRVVEKEKSGAPADSNHGCSSGSPSCTGTGSQRPAATNKSKLLAGGRDVPTSVDDWISKLAKFGPPGPERLAMAEKQLEDMIAELERDGALKPREEGGIPDELLELYARHGFGTKPGEPQWSPEKVAPEVNKWAAEYADRVMLAQKKKSSAGPGTGSGGSSSSHSRGPADDPAGLSETLRNLSLDMLDKK